MTEKHKQLDVFRHTPEGKAMLSNLQSAQELTNQSLTAYGSELDVWVFGYSGGKDSTATLTYADWAMKQGLIPTPKHRIVLYSDTLMELPSLEYSVHRLLGKLESEGWRIVKSVPRLDAPAAKPERFFVMMLGRGYPPPNGKFRWCTDRLKVRNLQKLYGIVLTEYSQTFLDIDGIRKGESAARDQRILSSCSADDGECGQGWFHKSQYGDAYKLSPILHWRVCHVWDWIVEAWAEHGYPVEGVIDTYGVDITDDGIEEPLSARTGCIGCPLVTTSSEKQPKLDKALRTVVSQSQWNHLEPYERLGEIYWRLRWDVECRHINLRGQKGCLTLESRLWALEKILKLQRESVILALNKGVTPYLLIKPDEEAVIRQMIADRVFPDPKRYAAGEFDDPPVIDKDVAQTQE